MAKECSQYHSKNTDSFRQWMDKGTGESLAGSGGKDIPEINAYLASDGAKKFLIIGILKYRFYIIIFPWLLT